MREQKVVRKQKLTAEDYSAPCTRVTEVSACMYFYVHLYEDEKEQAQAQDEHRDEDEDVDDNEDVYED